MIFALISAYLAYRRAKDNGRNGILWAFIAAAVFIGTQIVVALAIGLAIGIFFAATQRPETDLGNGELFITVIAVIMSFGSTWAVLKYLEKPPREEVLTTPPPPPENFS